MLTPSPRPLSGRRHLITFAAATALALLIVGCPKGGETSTSGSTNSKSGNGDTWVIFEVYEAGTGNPLSATVWPKGMDEDFDTIVQGQAGSSIRFDGIGRQESGYALGFGNGQKVSLMVWSPGHEMKNVEHKLKKGENLLPIELKRTEVDDDKVPEKIRLNVLESLPTEGPKSGS